jgi:hypothetical protein
MTKSRTRHSKRRNARSVPNRASRGGGPGEWASPTKGDIPKMHKFDQTTVSTIPPKVSSTFITRQFQGNITITAAPTTPNTTTMYFQLSNLANATNFENLWDQYRIRAVRQSVKPQNNAIGLVTNSTTSIVDFYWVIDYDNDSALSSVNSAQEYDNCMLLTAGEDGCRTFAPRIALSAYSGAFSSFANMEDSWIDCASPSVRHYGSKFYVPGTTAAQTTNQAWDVLTEYWVEFRSVF